MKRCNSSRNIIINIQSLKNDLFQEQTPFPRNKTHFAIRLLNKMKDSILEENKANNWNSGRIKKNKKVKNKINLNSIKIKSINDSELNGSLIKNECDYNKCNVKSFDSNICFKSLELKDTFFKHLKNNEYYYEDQKEMTFVGAKKPLSIHSNKKNPEQLNSDKKQLKSSFFKKLKKTDAKLNGWTENEEYMLLMLNKNDKLRDKWKTISDIISTKTAKQCLFRFRKLNANKILDNKKISQLTYIDEGKEVAENNFRRMSDNENSPKHFWQKNLSSSSKNYVKNVIENDFNKLEEINYIDDKPVLFQCNDPSYDPLKSYFLPSINNVLYHDKQEKQEIIGYPMISYANQKPTHQQNNNKLIFSPLKNKSNEYIMGYLSDKEANNKFSNQLDNNNDLITKELSKEK